ncbi:MAG: carbamoyl-phosphate synthase large subunit [Alphaproteobacteria bacterium]|nr:carbamoyl-phosphate synthase large subunit [Alphaproteobacteria bacterium]
MPKRTDISSILIIGAGPIVIGQACEFDYSGAQACKTLRAEGYRIILVNSNPATIMTDPEVADRTYIEPITADFVAKVIAAERPDALLPTMGGQTALNCALELERRGVLREFGVELIGARSEAINMAEDRQLFREAMDRIGLESPKSVSFTGDYYQREGAHKEIVSILKPESEAQALAAMEEVGLPAVIRPSFTLGGTGGGIAYNREEFLTIVAQGVAASPTNHVLIEESVLGWKEYEMEVIRDKADNCIIVCSIENIDPMGVHTGDSITVAPALTLTDKEYQIMRSASIAVLREIGVETGGSNVQFAVHPETGRLVVIEMNPRVSRSSALASKATGFPIAKVAARLAVGYTLDELTNDITGVTPASFEPTIDYVVTKIPRFAFEKFPGAVPILTTSMKSVGEAMAIGRSFEESMQKALRSLEIGLSGFDEIEIEGLGGDDDRNTLLAELARSTPDRILKVAQAFRHGLSLADAHKASAIDPWFLARIEGIVRVEAEVRERGLPRDAEKLRELKALGFSDKRLAMLTGQSTEAVTAARHALGVRPAFKRIDTCAAEFAALTPYMYSTYEVPGGDGRVDCEADPSLARKVMIIGGGPNRIGQGIEFDYCCCHAAFALHGAGFESIMVNCNPETVSTDYDTSDRLYFEPLTAEDVLEIVHVEASRGTLLGCIVQFGGQTPLKLSGPLARAGVPVLGTTPDALDLAEDRERFRALLDRIGLKQPRSAIAASREAIFTAAREVGFPLLLRPSNVLGGRAMEIVREDGGLERAYVTSRRFDFEEEGPVLIDAYLQDATEVDVDALSDGHDVFVAGILEHIEEAGIHSGDSACSLPPYSLSPAIVAELVRQTEVLARALSVVGLMNVQFAIQGGEIHVLEVNPRASRTVPFVAKTIGIPIASIAARVMAGERLASFGLVSRPLDHVAVKEAVFPFARFSGVDTILGPEMRSTGEVMGLDRTFERAFAKSQIAAGTHLPTAGTVFVSVKDRDKPAIVPLARRLVEMGFSLMATGGTADFLAGHAIPVRRINKVLEGRPHIVDSMKNGEVQLVFNTSEGLKSIEDSRQIRRTALQDQIPYYTTVAGAKAAVAGIAAIRGGSLDVTALQDYTARARG